MNEDRFNKICDMIPGPVMTVLVHIIAGLWLASSWWSRHYSGLDDKGHQQYDNKDAEPGYYYARKAGWRYKLSKWKKYQRNIGIGNLDIASLYPSVVMAWNPSEQN